MIRHRWLGVAVGIGLLAWALAGAAWAHPERQPFTRAGDVGIFDAPGEPWASSAAAQDHPAPRRSGPSALSLAAGAIALLAGLPNRRRTLTMALSLLLATMAFEGVAHAALHLGHVGHADAFPIGAAPSPSALTEQTADPLASDLLPSAGPAPQRGEPRVASAALPAARERAPPPSPAA